MDAADDGDGFFFIQREKSPRASGSFDLALLSLTHSLSASHSE